MVEQWTADYSAAGLKHKHGPHAGAHVKILLRGKAQTHIDHSIAQVSVIHGDVERCLERARLISLAPRMLEALEAIAKRATPPGHMAQQLDDVYDIADAIIREARGES